MSAIFLLPFGSDYKDRMHRTLPLFYMEDYSTMGLVVNRFEDSVEILRKQRCSIIPKNEGAVIVVNHYGQLPEIVEVLENHGISCEISDVVDRVYQG